MCLLLLNNYTIDLFELIKRNVCDDIYKNNRSVKK